MSQSRTAFPDHGGKRRIPRATNVLRLEATQAQRNADRRALAQKARERSQQATARRATTQEGTR